MKKRQGRNWIIPFLILIGAYILIVWVKNSKTKEKIIESTENTENEESHDNHPVEPSLDEKIADSWQEEIAEPNEEAEEVVNMVELQKDIKLMEAGSILDISNLDSDFIKELFYSEAITDSLFEKINGISYQENDVILRKDLRYLRVLHMGFDGKVHIGELIVNEQIAVDVLEIMEKLYENAYPIEKMILVDKYRADDDLSMADNNSSAFNYRMIAGTNRLSKHGMGMAVDINPRYNPYIRKGENGEIMIEPENGAEFADRSQEFEYKIDESDLCCLLFKEHGFVWGGDWNTVKDYQHFEKTSM